MRFLRSTTLVTLTVALGACDSDGVTGSARARVPVAPDGPGFSYNAAAPVPQIVSATVVGRLDNAHSIVRITFNDTATNEFLTSAYFTPDGGFGGAETQNIAGTPTTGSRTVDLYPSNTATTVRLANAWQGADGLVFSAFSQAVTIGSSSTVASTKGNGRNK